MVKKLITLGVALIILFGVSGLAACTESLAEYKTIKTIELQAYADAKGENNYSESGWAAILQAAADGKTEIEIAADKLQVDNAVNIAKQKIDLIYNKEHDANLHLLSRDLQEEIKQDYLDSIIKPNFPEAAIIDVKIGKYYGTYDYYQGGYPNKAGTFVAVTLNDSFSNESNDEDIWKVILMWEDGVFLTMEEAFIQEKEFDYNTIKILHITDLKLEHLERIRQKRQKSSHGDIINEYCGTYNGAVAIIFNALTLPAVASETVDGITFDYGDRNFIKIFKNDNFYSMQEAYDLGLINHADLISIRNIHNSNRQGLSD